MARESISDQQDITGATPATGVDGLLDATPGPLHPQALETLLGAHDLAWADPSARHPAGRRSRSLLDRSRAVLAEGFGVRPDELTFHASGDQAARTALALLARGRHRRTAPPVASAVEHLALLRWLRAVEIVLQHDADGSGAHAIIDTARRTAALYLMQFEHVRIEDDSDPAATP